MLRSATSSADLGNKSDSPGSSSDRLRRVVTCMIGIPFVIRCRGATCAPGRGAITGPHFIRDVNISKARNGNTPTLTFTDAAQARAARRAGPYLARPPVTVEEGDIVVAHSARGRLAARLLMLDLGA
ncbi:hypothetical protein GCM10027059_50600 [Myceligenerans halotolerans]